MIQESVQCLDCTPVAGVDQFVGAVEFMNHARILWHFDDQVRLEDRQVLTRDDGVSIRRVENDDGPRRMLTDDDAC